MSDNEALNEENINTADEHAEADGNVAGASTDEVSSNTSDNDGNDKPEAHKQRYANAANPSISAIVEGLYRFKDAETATHKLDEIKEKFTLSRHQEGMPEDRPCALLWIKDFAMTKEESDKGYMGNYGIISVEECEEGLYTLKATKLESELKYHPRRRRTQQRCPNWGHPILRNIKKGKTYPTVEAAAHELQQLHLEYPDTTIPGQNKLYVMIYSRAEDPKNPVQKYILEIDHLQTGGFTIKYEVNTYKPTIRKEAPTTELAAEEPQGRFTSMVALKRNKKRPLMGDAAPESNDAEGDADEPDDSAPAEDTAPESDKQE